MSKADRKNKFVDDGKGLVITTPDGKTHGEKKEKGKEKEKGKKKASFSHLLRLASTLPPGSPERVAALSVIVAGGGLSPNQRLASVKVAHRLDGVRGHKLMPANIKAKIPDIGGQEHEPDPMVWVKYFSPYSQAVWFVTEFDGQDEMFGWADLGMGGGELGYISLSDLEGLNRRGLPLVERDTSFRPKPLSQAKRGD